MFYLLLDVTFGLNGLGKLLVDSIQFGDIYLVAGVLFALSITFVIVILISNLIFSYNKYREPEIIDTALKTPIDNDVEIEYEESIKHYLLRRLKSPYTIIGAILVAFFIFISIFPQAFTEFTFEDAFDPAAGSWSPPSSDHPLGQTTLGWEDLVCQAS